MGAILRLPPMERKTKEERDDLSVACMALIQEGLRERNLERVGWWVADLYCRGLRDISILDYERGLVEVSYEDEGGDLTLRWDEPMTRLQTEIGRLSRLDVSPFVEKHAFSLESLRNASVAQVLLQSTLSKSAEDAFKIQFFTGLCMYGTYAQAAWRDDSVDSPMAHIREMIPPWELLPVVANASNPTDRRGVMRSRLFPLIALENMEGVDLPDGEEPLNIVEIPYGASIHSFHGPHSYTSTAARAGGVGGSRASLFDRPPGHRKDRTYTGKKDSKPESDVEKFVPLREIYLDGPDETVSRYIVMAGRWPALSIDYLKEGRKVPQSLGISRYQDTGRFYGRSFMSKVIPLALELESLLEKSIEAAADSDRFGIVVFPTSWGISDEDLKATETPRFLFKEDELGGERERIDHVQPTTVSDFAGRLFTAGLGALDRVVAQGPGFSGIASGRADSGESFKELAEQGSTHLLPVAVSTQSSYVTVFRSIIHNIKVRSARSPGTLEDGVELARINNQIAGISLDHRTGRMKLDPESVPGPWSVDYGIASKDPTSGERRRGEALALNQMDPPKLSDLEFIILNYQEGWNYPVGSRAVYENYIKAVLINLMMFNDGKTLGELPGATVSGQQVGEFFDDTSDMAEVHWHAVQEFISGPEFTMASPDIRNKFYERVELLRSKMGQTLPKGMSYLEEAAAVAATGGATEVGAEGGPAPQLEQSV